jgi:MFS family permease
MRGVEEPCGPTYTSKPRASTRAAYGTMSKAFADLDFQKLLVHHALPQDASRQEEWQPVRRHLPFAILLFPRTAVIQSLTSSRRWVILAAVFINLAMVYGLWYSYSVFLVALLHDFGWSRSTVAGGFSVFLLVNGAISPFIGWLAGRIGVRRIILAGAGTLGVGLLLTAQTSQWWHLYLAFGLITSVGVTMAGWLPSIILIHGWFLDRVGTAVGIVSAGIGVGIFAVPLTQLLIDLCGWRWTFRIMAVAIVGWLLPATLGLVRDPAREEPVPARPLKSSEARSGSWSLLLALRGGRYWALAGVFFLGNMTTQLLFVHQVAYLVDHGASPLAAASVGGLAGLASIVGKIGWGALSDRTGREVSYSWALACLVVSLGFLVLAGRHPTSLLPFVYAVLFGLGYAGTAALTPPAASDLFAGPGFSAIFGSFQTVLCLGAALGAWSGGKIFDLTGSYNIALWLALAGSLAAPTCMWIAAPRRANPMPGRRGKRNA